MYRIHLPSVQVSRAISPLRMCMRKVCPFVKRLVEWVFIMGTPTLHVYLQGRSQPHSTGWARVPLSSFFPQISINFSSNFIYFLPHFGLPGGRVAQLGRLWLRYCVPKTPFKFQYDERSSTRTIISIKSLFLIQDETVTRLFTTFAVNVR